MKAPEITGHLRDAQIDEGNRFEFFARIDGQPVPEIRWFKVVFFQIEDPFFLAKIIDN